MLFFSPKRKPVHRLHVNKRSRLLSAPGANYYNGCQTSNVWRRNMSRSRESRPRGSRKQQTKITYAARARTLNRFKQNYHGGQGFAPLAHSLLGSVNSKRAHPPSGICRAFVILFWKSYKCPTVGPGVQTKTPRWVLKIGCKLPTRDNTKIAVSSK